METQHSDWKILQLFTVAVIAAIIGSALFNATLAEAATTSEAIVEERLAMVRKYFQHREAMLTDISHENSNIVLSQSTDYPKWTKWNKSADYQ